MNRTAIIIAVVVAVAGLGIFGLSMNDSSDMTNMQMSSQSDESSSSENVEPNTVVIDSLDFQQKEIIVKKGTTVTWKNEDTAKHNVVFDDESVAQVEDGKLIGEGEELKFTFSEIGEFSYFCEPHPFMKAVVIVTE